MKIHFVRQHSVTRSKVAANLRKYQTYHGTMPTWKFDVQPAKLTRDLEQKIESTNVKSLFTLLIYYQWSPKKYNWVFLTLFVERYCIFEIQLQASFLCNYLDESEEIWIICQNRGNCILKVGSDCEQVGFFKQNYSSQTFTEGSTNVIY